ncbi:MAG: transporter [Bacteroidales bacterium]|nr:transporter [Bacteroidales bacterium]
MKKILTSILIFLFVFFLQLNAQKIVTDRPDQTESSTTIPFKSFQIESGFLLGYWELGGENERLALGPSTLFRYGIAKWIEIRLVSQYANLKVSSGNTSTSHSGFLDLEIGAKVQVFKKEDVNTEIAFLSHLVAPSGSTELSTGKVGVINKLAFSHSLTEQIGLGYNIGYNYFGLGSGMVTYSLVFGFGLTDALGLYLEPYGEWVISEDFFANFNAGLTYLVKDNFQLDFSFGTGLNHKMNFLSVGLSWNISPKASNKS